MRLAPPLLRLVALALVAAAAHAEPAEFGAALLAEIHQARAARGLPAVESDPALVAVATARAAAMARDGWFGLTSPSGEAIEGALDAAGVPFRLVTEKLVRTSATARQLGEEWSLRPEAQRNSLLHPAVRRIGIGIAIAGDERIVEIVLIEPQGAAAVATTAPAIDAEAARRSFRELLDRRRGEMGREPLRSQEVLEAAAQQHAEAYLEALTAGRGPETIATLADRVTHFDRVRRGSNFGSASSKDAFMLREISAQSGDRRPVGDDEVLSVVIGDARDAAAALETIEGERSRPYCLEPGMRVVGVGVAAGATPGGERVVWVVAVRRR